MTKMMWHDVIRPTHDSYGGLRCIQNLSKALWSGLLCQHEQTWGNRLEAISSEAHNLVTSAKQDLPTKEATQSLHLKIAQGLGNPTLC